MARGGKRPGAGKPKGSKASHTLQAAKAKESLIEAYIAKAKPINDALLAKAESGDIQAIKELHDRVWGRSSQAIDVTSKGESVVITDPRSLAIAKRYEEEIKKGL